LNHLGLKNNIIKILTKAGINNISELYKLSPNDLLTIPGIGPKTANKITVVLQQCKKE
jgi:DNA-directed RNA polymerase alpha subunit